jgi:hypothetical protein
MHSGTIELDGDDLFVEMTDQVTIEEDAATTIKTSAVKA